MKRLLLTLVLGLITCLVYSQSPQTKGDFTYWDYNKETTYVLKSIYSRTPSLINGEHYVSGWTRYGSADDTTSKIILNDHRVRIIWHTTKIVDRYSLARVKDTIIYDIPLQVFSKEDTEYVYNVKYNSKIGKIEFKYTKPGNTIVNLIVTFEDKDLMFEAYDDARYKREEIMKKKKIREQRKVGWN